MDRTQREALTLGVAVVPLYVVIRDVLKGFKVNNELVSVFLTGAIAYELAEYSGVLEQRIHYHKHNERVRRRRTSSDPRICSLATDFAYA